MTERLCSGIAEWLYRSGAIREEDKELYAYGVFCFIINVGPMLFGIPLAVLLGLTLPEGSAFTIPFVLFRKFSGGYHAATLRRCLILSVGMLCVYYRVLSHVIHTAVGLPVLLVILSAACMVTLCVFSPVDAKNRQLSLTEKRVFHRVVIVLSILTAVLCLILYRMTHCSIVKCILFGVIFTAQQQYPVVIGHFVSSRKAIVQEKTRR